MSRKLEHLALVGLVTVVCMLTGYCWTGTAGNNNQEHYALVEKQATIAANHLPHKQEGNLNNHQIFQSQQIGQKPFRNYSSTIASGGLPGAIKCVHTQRKHYYNPTDKNGSRQESAPYAVSASRFYYVIALRRIVI